MQLLKKEKKGPTATTAQQKAPRHHKMILFVLASQLCWCHHVITFSLGIINSNLLQASFAPNMWKVNSSHNGANNMLFVCFFTLCTRCFVSTSRLDFPNPVTDFRECGQTQPSRVCDPSHLLSTAGAQAVDAILKQIEDNFKAACGKNYQVALAVVDKMRFANYRSNSEIQVNSISI